MNDMNEMNDMNDMNDMNEMNEITTIENEDTNVERRKLTKEEKLARIAHEACTHFIDDLPEILDHPLFPSNVAKLLFAPGNGVSEGSLPQASSWSEIHAWLT